MINQYNWLTFIYAIQKLFNGSTFCIARKGGIVPTDDRQPSDRKALIIQNIDTMLYKRLIQFRFGIRRFWSVGG